MMRLIAITDTGTADAVEARRSDPRFAELVIVRGGGLAALLAATRVVRWFDIRSRLDTLRELGEDQQRLEALMRLGPMLPAVENAVVDDRDEAGDLIAASAAFLSETLSEFGASVQFQIQISWRPEEMLQAEAPRLRDIIAQAGADRAARGAAVANFMNGLREQLAQSCRQNITATAKDIVQLPSAGETELVNLVALIDRAGEAELDRAVEAIDAAYPGALKIRYTGPLPPISFAGIEVKKTGDGDIKAARRLLGLDGAPSTITPREAFLARVRALHPDAANAAPTAEVPDISALKDAYVLLSRVGDGSKTSGKPLPLVTIRREGQIARRA